MKLLNKLIAWWKAIPAETLDHAFDEAGFYPPEVKL